MDHASIWLAKANDSLAIASAIVTDGIRVEYDGPKFAMTPEWLLDAEVSDRAVRLWAVLHRHASATTAECHPTRASLATRLRCSVDTIDRAVAELEQVGAMTVTRRPTGEGNRHLPSIYRLHFDGGDRTHAARGGRTGAAQNESHVNESQERYAAPASQEPTQSLELFAPEASKAVAVEDDFDVFWRTYPRRVAKGAAKRAWKTAVKKTTTETLIAGAQRYAAQRAGEPPQFTKHPSVWLNAECWDDEPDAPHRPRLRNASVLLRLAASEGPG